MKCPYCGGRMVIEYFGTYGAVYPLKKMEKQERELSDDLYMRQKGITQKFIVLIAKESQRM